MDGLNQIASLLIIVIAFGVNLLVRNRQRSPMRRIAAFELLPRMIGESIEANRPLHVSLGSATIGDETTMLALAGSEFIYYLTREVAIGDAAPLFTVSEGAAVPLAVDTLRRAYRHENRLKQYNVFSSRWYPVGQQSLAFAAALMTMQADDKLSGNVLVGRYGTELALILDAAARRKRTSIAVSDHLEGQAIAYALADEALIGEEIFAAAAYMDKDGVQYRVRNKVLDAMRSLTIIAILLMIILPYIAPTLVPFILNLVGGN